MESTTAGYQPLTAVPMIPAGPCTSWSKAVPRQRTHASTLVTSTGGVRPDAVGGRRRHASSPLPSSGTSSQSPPV